MKKLALVAVVVVACGEKSGDMPSPDATVSGDAMMADGHDDPDAPMRPPSLTSLAVAPSRFHTCAVSTQGVVKCWGEGGVYGQLGLENHANIGDQPGEMGVALPAVKLGTGLRALQIATGGSRSCALLEDHTIKCWGANTMGELGLGHMAYRGDRSGTMGDALERVDLGSGHTAVAIAMGSSHTCAILDDHSVKCWGDNSYGQLGLGDRLARGGSPTQMGNNLPAVSLGTGRTAKALAAGIGFTCALLDDNTVKCWGRNEYGQLGIGTTDHRGDQAAEMGDALPAVSFGTGRTVIALASAVSHSCAVLDSGAVKCWGDNVTGELGTGPTGRRGDQPGEMGDNLPAVPLGTGRTATAVAVGDLHSCALLDTQQVKCWGYNAYGNLGLGDKEYRNDLVELGDALPSIDFGAGRWVRALASNDHFSCVVLDNDSVKCWGRGNRDGTSGGWLGLGDLAHRGDGPNEMGDMLPAVMLW